AGAWRGGLEPQTRGVRGGRGWRGVPTVPVPFDLPRLGDPRSAGVADGRRRHRRRRMNPTYHTSRGQLLWRGLTKRCARCGSGHLFKRWFTMVDDCPRCGLHFEREQGYGAGALASHIGIPALTFVLAFAIGLALTPPDIPVVPMLAVLIPLM